MQFPRLIPRALARRCLPFEVRLRTALLQRHLRDRNVHFSRPREVEPAVFAHKVCDYARPIIDYPGQTHFGAAKRHNVRLLASKLHGTVIAPGETFSVWHIAPRPSLANGYGAAAAIRNRRLITEVGGSICLLSTVLYNVALLGALDVVERHCHSVDTYGTSRYFELGRDAAIEYGYLDLRFRNPHPYALRLSIDVADSTVTASLWSVRPHDFTVSIEVDAERHIPANERILTDRSPGEDTVGIEVQGRRIIRFDNGTVREEALPASYHHAVPADDVAAQQAIAS